MPANDLERTISDASAGDRASIEDLLTRYLPQMRAFVRLHMGALADLESCGDIVQSACRQALQNLDDFEYRGELAFRKWLLVACLNRLRDHKKHWLRQARDARRTVPLAESAIDHFETPSGELVRREELAALAAALDRLPGQYREVITLSRLGGLSHAEIAELRGTTEGATRVLLHRALARLGSELTVEP